MFIDLENSIKNNTLPTLPSVRLYAIGGFPIKLLDGKYYLLNNELTKEFLSVELTKSLGLSGMMTFMNKRNLSEFDMGLKLKELGHNWGLNWLTVSFGFFNISKDVEIAFLRDNKFYESWSVIESNVFGFSGSLKDFKRFVSNKNDKTFGIDVRNVMQTINNNFDYLWT